MSDINNLGSFSSIDAVWARYPEGGKEGEDGFFTETLARIYIKQGRHNKALDILRRLNANSQQKNTFIADQIRFLEKLIINNNKK